MKVAQRVLFLGVVIWIGYSVLPAPTTSNWTPAVSQPARRIIIGGRAEPVDSGNALLIQVDGAAFPDQAAVEDATHLAYRYVTGRIGYGADAPFTVHFAYDGMSHGLADTASRTLYAYGNASIGMTAPINIMAHEMGHLLVKDRLGHDCAIDLMLDEGFATWGAGRYWLGGLPDFKSYIRQIYGTSTFLPLAQTYNGNDIADMNRRYYQWASLIEYLLTISDMPHLERIYCTTQNSIASGAYYETYGVSFAQIEDAWQQWLRSP